jgi:hypothetical protein
MLISKRNAHQEREGDRITTFAPVEIHGYRNKARVNALLRDVSSGGARMHFADNRSVPDFFQLWCPSFSTYVGCHVRWRDKNDIGVRFDELVPTYSFKNRLAHARRRLPQSLAALSISLPKAC